VTPEVFRQVNELKSRGALFIVNHSGGKDSQAMLITLRRFVPAEQLILVHADLGEVEWAGLKEHIKATAPDLPLEVALAIYKDGSEKTLLGEWERKGKAPSPAQRWCTSDLKRGPIEKIVRRVMKERGIQVAVNCMGMRAGESCDRAKLEPWKLNKRLSLAGREVWDWLPIHGLTTEEVFQTIALLLLLHHGKQGRPHPGRRAPAGTLPALRRAREEDRLHPAVGQDPGGDDRDSS
jgi:DNA sulfur modification protein DndC